MLVLASKVNQNMIIKCNLSHVSCRQLFAMQRVVKT
jgi:hypothetical protein